MDKKLMLATVSALIKQNGKKCKVTHVDGGTSSAFGVIMRPSVTLMQGSSVTEGSLVCMLQGTIKQAPTPGDVIRVGTNDYVVTQVDRIQPDGVLTYVYTCSVSI